MTKEKLSVIPDQENLTRESLETLLLGHGVNCLSWGLKGTKSVEKLLVEIKGGELFLAEKESGELLSVVFACAARVNYTDRQGREYKLKEDRQVFRRDGSIRVRNYLTAAVYEKLKPEENPETALKRGLKEELGLGEQDYSMVYGGVEEQLTDAKCYPVLQTYFTWEMFDVQLNESGFRPEGYIEEQKDKTSYFVWVELK